ncbi:FxSxx-COOH system tetratricopeptide repeat protein [Streptomyces sp. NPDC051976]|uniref:FxSxx-COOH system tetratricopeptide repeat protein n=1 Tax=Streptomyces sp. NPDC051976 TaxID=3154947 RepID=UPI0034305466
MTREHPRLRVEPVVSWPREAETGHAYLVTVDLRGPVEPHEWPYEAEEFTFGITLDGASHFVCEALDHPGVVLHRFGGTYGAARFVVTAGQTAGPAALRLTVSNHWGVPIRRAELRSVVVPARADWPDGDGDGVTIVPARTPATSALPPAPAPVPWPDPAPDAPVTISFAGYHRAWAAWIASLLEGQGRRVVLQRWDPPADSTVEQGLRDLLLGEGRVLIVLSEWYLRLGQRSEEEWNTALRSVLGDRGAWFAAVSVTPAALPAAVAALGPADLWGLAEAEAERRLLGRLGIRASRTRRGRARTPQGPRFPLEQPAVWGGVPRRNTRFTGRDDLLQAVHRALVRAEPGTAVATLHGLSGVGKTQIATEYVYRYGPEYDVVWWVRAGDRGTLREKLAGLAPALGLATGREYGERLRAVRDALRRGEPYHRWLVVLDGADQPEEVHDLVPEGPGHVLITSQTREWVEHNSALIEVPVFSRAESVAFVRRRAPWLDDAEADRLADALGDLALALAQNAGALNDSTMTVDDYIALLRRGADAGPGLKVAADFQLTYYTAFSILLNRLREDQPEAVDLLRLCVLFAPGPVPAHLLRRDPEVARYRQGWEQVLGSLAQWSVAQTEPAGAGSASDDGERIHVHPLVYQAVRAEIPHDAYPALVARVHQALAAANPGRPADTANWPLYSELARQCSAYGVLDSAEPAVEQLVLDCLRYLYVAAEHASGLALSRRALDAWRARGGDDHPRIWDLVHEHANLLRISGDHASTETLDRAAHTHLRARHGARHPDTLRAAAGLAADLRGLARYDEAEEVSAAVLADSSTAFGERDPRTLVAQNNHAVSLRLLGRYRQALDLDRATLAARRELLGPGHRWTLLSERVCGEGLRLLGSYEEAAAVHTRNTRAHRSALGSDHSQTLRAELELALSLLRMGDPTAGALLGRLRERCVRILDDSHPLIAMVTAGCSVAAREYDLDEARRFGVQVLTTYRERLGDRHPFTAGALGNHGLVLRASGEREESQAVLENALAAMTVAVGADHPWALACALNAAGAYHLAGEESRAAELARRTAARAVERLGADHPLTTACQDTRQGAHWDFEPTST